MQKMDHIIRIFRKVRNELGITMPVDDKTVRLTSPQSKANGGLEWVSAAY